MVSTMMLGACPGAACEAAAEWKTDAGSWPGAMPLGRTGDGVAGVVVAPGAFGPPGATPPCPPGPPTRNPDKTFLTNGA